MPSILSFLFFCLFVGTFFAIANGTKRRVGAIDSLTAGKYGATDWKIISHESLEVVAFSDATKSIAAISIGAPLYSEINGYKEYIGTYDRTLIFDIAAVVSCEKTMRSDSQVTFKLRLSRKTRGTESNDFASITGKESVIYPWLRSNISVKVIDALSNKRH